MSAPSSPDARSLTRNTLVLSGLVGVAVAQPLYDLVSEYPEFFVAYRATWADILALAALLSIALPLLGVVCTLLAGLISTHLADRVADTLVAMLVALFAVQALKHLGVGSTMGPWPLVALSMVLGGIAAVAHARFSALQTFGTVLAVGALVFPSMFLLRPSIWRIVFPDRTETSTEALEGHATPVVLIVFDQLPVSSLMDGEGRVDAARYPNFAALADDGTWYRNASAVANKSAWAVPAILTGQYPDPAKTLPSWLDYPDSLFTLLHPAYSMRVEEPITQLCPPELCGSTARKLSLRVRAELGDLAVVYAHVVAPPAWSARLPALTDNWKNFGVSAAERLRRDYSDWQEGHIRWDWTERWAARRDTDRRVGFNDFVAAIGTERQPALYFAHVLLPHEPYEFLPSGSSYMLEPGPHALESNGHWVKQPATIREVYQRHLLQVAYVDKLLGGLMDALKETGLYERSLVVVTADHGASFVPGGSFKDPTESNYAAILSVPLIIKAAGQRAGRTDDRNAETIDVLPTIADALGIDVGWPLDGNSLLREPDPARIYKTMLYGAAQGRIEYSVAGVIAGRDAEIDRKLNLFGPAGDPLRRASSVLDQQLVGRRVDQLHVGNDASVDVVLDYPAIFSRVELDSGFVPARISGRVTWSGDSDRPATIELAVAVNGVLTAMTQVALGDGNGVREAWSVIVPEKAFLEGANRVQVLVVETTAAAPLLRPAYEGDRDHVGPVNILMPTAERLHGVKISGFRPLEWTRDGIPVRWTETRGIVRVPIDPEEPPVGLDLFVRYANAKGSRLRIRANGCWVFHRRVREAFKARISFGDCPVEGTEFVLEFMSDRFASKPDINGVGVSSIVLLDELEWQE